MSIGSMSKGEETRHRIVTEAATLFNQRGFEGGSMSELMKATGLDQARCGCKEVGDSHHLFPGRRIDDQPPGT